MKRITLLAIAFAAATAHARADMVTERWGIAGPVQHAGTVRHEAAADKGTLLHFDLKALPKGATIYRARLVLVPERAEPYGLSGHMHHGAALGIHVDYRTGFEVVTVPADDKAPARSLPTPPPLHRWFDATEVVRAWAKAMPKDPALLVRQARPWKKDATFLEITYDGKLAEPPEPVTNVRAFCRSGQVFLTWKEIEDLSDGAERCTWGPLMKKLSNISPDGPIPRDDKREVRYHIYRSREPIARDTIHKAQLFAEVMPGSGFNTRIYNRLWQGENTLWKMDDNFAAVRLAVEPGKLLAPGVGVCVRTVVQDGPAYYAVVTTIDGRENTRDLAPANVVGPVAEKVAEPEPVLQEETTSKGQHGPTVRRRYVYWAEPPLAPRPLQYGLIVQYHPDKVAKPAPLEVTRGTGQSIEPYLDRIQRADAVVLAVSDDPEGTFWQGGNTCRGSLLSYAQGKWEPFPPRRQAKLVAWALKTLPVDEQQVYAYGGIWGLWELRQPQTYSAFIHWGMGEPTKGFLSYNRCLGVWGPPDVYKGRPDSENPYAMYDYAKFVLEDPARKLPFQMHQPCGGTHTTELGWPAVPRLQRALMDAHQPFVATIGKKDSAPAPAVLREFQAGRLPIRRDQSKPAFANCTLDENPGSGDIQSGDANGFLNGYLLWEPTSVTDEKTHWEMTVYLDKTAPLEECRVDLTPRDCQKFLLKPGTTVQWTNGAGQSGEAMADRHDLVTLKAVQVGKGKNRVRVEAVLKRDVADNPAKNDPADKKAEPEKLKLWNRRAPIGDSKFEQAEARITVHKPEKPNGTAIVICPGGGYGGLVTGPEGHGIAAWLNRHGITGVVLEYRLPAGRPYVPLLDAQRAIRTVRGNAKAWGIDPAKVGIMGFSAGGHLASTAGTHFDDGDPKADDPIDRNGCRPDFMVLVYPVVTMGEKTHGGSKNNLLGKNPDQKLVDLFSNEKQVTAKTPPAFLAHAKDDRAVVPENSKAFYDALQAQKVPAKYLELPSGGHGLNGYKGPMWDAWQEQSLAWLVELKFIPAAAEKK